MVNYLKTVLLKPSGTTSLPSFAQLAIVREHGLYKAKMIYLRGSVGIA